MALTDSPDQITVSNIEQSQGVAIGAGATAIVGYTAEQVSALLVQIGTTFQPKPFDGRSPYVGLASFQEADADRFFGRENLITELVARVDALYSRAIFIAGPSGSGKSSLARAGLMHVLKTGGLPHSDTWLYETMQPGRAPLDELARVVSRWANSVKAGDEFRASTNDLTMLHRWAEIALGDARDRRAVLLVDQFEEIFTQVTDENERVAFLNLLTHAATVENGRVTILVALRSDFVSHCAAYPQLNALLSKQFLQVGAMTPAELVSAIAQPALRAGLRIDPDLIAQIVNDMRDAPNALPLMQFALNDLFESERAKGGVIALTLQDYIARGGLHKALERHADAAFAQLDASQQDLARAIFGGVIEVGRGTVDTRRTALFDELVPANATSVQVQVVVQKLADARLLATDERDGKETVTLAHEQLIDAWQWLRRLVNENRGAIALQNEIAQDAREWEANGRDASYLYTGARLAVAREQLETDKILLSGLAQQFVQAGIQAVEIERRARLRRVQFTFGGLATAFFVFRIYLELDGYPQIGASTFHISNALWGGLLLIFAVLILLLFEIPWVMTFAALLGGIGAGLFIDEVGKFITNTNNYFDPLALPIIYSFQVVLWLFFLVALSDRRDRNMLLQHAFENIKDVLNNVSQRKPVVALLEFVKALERYIKVKPNRVERLRAHVMLILSSRRSRATLKSLLAIGFLLLAFGTLGNAIGFYEYRLPLQYFANHPILFVMYLVFLTAIGFVSMVVAVVIVFGKEHLGLRIGTLGLAFALIIVNPITFYFSQDAAIWDVLGQLVLVGLAVLYRRQFLLKPSTAFPVDA